MESLEKRLMKLLITLILVGALFTALVAYSNSKPSNETVTEETVYKKREHPPTNDSPPNDFPEMRNQ